MGMGIGGNGNKLLGINGNEITILDIQVTWNGNRSKVWEWEGMGAAKVILAYL